MNDRFKFRIFLKAHNQMCNVHTLHTGTNKVIISTRYGNSSVQINDYNILMQCTGLKDKKKKLIYEGDILKINETSRLVVVKFKGISFELFAKPTNLVGYHNDKYIPEDCEIVGNIYENPELFTEVSE